MEHELGWDSVNAYDEWSLGASNLGREKSKDPQVENLSYVRRGLRSALGPRIRLATDPAGRPACAP